MKNPAWTTDELDRMVQGAGEGAFGAMSHSNKAPYSTYAYDLLEAFHDHPNASDQVRDITERWMQDVVERAVEKPLGAAHWGDSTLGFPMPSY
jgi:hypothetical protein